MASDPGKRGIKLLIYITCAAERLQSMLQGLRTARLITHLYLECAFIGGNYLSKPSIMRLIWLELAVKFPTRASSSNSLRLVPCSIILR